MARRLEQMMTLEQEGKTADALLRQCFGLSGTVLRRIKWLSDGILLDGVRVTTRARVRRGQILSARIDDPVRRSGTVAAAGALDIVYEDEDVLVLNKPAGMSVHPGPGHFDDTLGNFIVDYYDKTGQTADFHPVHRLDRGTSGLLVVAKHPFAQEKLKQGLHTGDFARGYLAVCEGIPNPPSGHLTAKIGPAPGSSLRQMLREDGLEACTQYQTEQVSGTRALVRLALETGRTHQIRVHMAGVGCPLVGDFLYGTETAELPRRVALHSATLALRQPVTAARLAFELPLPQELRALMEG